MGNNSPFIGIVANYRTSENEYYCLSQYVDAIVITGGLPVILPYHPGDFRGDFLGRFDGILLSGGTDFPPEWYGGQQHPAMTKFLVNRDMFEHPFAEALLKTRKPVLAICRGMQMVNVLRGGTIFDHTLDQRAGALNHQDGSPIDKVAHDVTVERNTHLFDICGSERFAVNSVHHQAVDRLGNGFRASAHAPDGVVEAIEDPDHPFLLGIQWHPEQLPTEEPHIRIIRSFVEACRTQT